MKTIAFVLAMSVSASAAQTVERMIDLSALGWGTVVEHAIDADGNPHTEEWAIESLETHQWRVVAVRSGVICAGPWFTPAGFVPFFTSARPITIGGATKLRVGTQTQFRIVRLDVPPCNVTGVASPQTK